MGYNFYNAGPGYDLVTGRGTPVASKLDVDLSVYGEPSKAVIEYEPPSQVMAGGIFGTVVEAENKAGQLSFGFDGTATISMTSGPAGYNFTPVSVPLSNGIAVIDGLSLSDVSGDDL